MTMMYRSPLVTQLKDLIKRLLTGSVLNRKGEVELIRTRSRLPSFSSVKGREEGKVTMTRL
jgi:hypothetical protein